jgi:hypothetical protein
MKTNIHTRLARRVSGGAMSLALAGCSVGADPANEDPVGSLRELQVNEDFTFATSRTAALSVSASDDVMAGQQDAALIVSRPDGVALFKGAVRRGETMNIEVPVALEFDTVEVQLTNQGQVRRQTLSLRGGPAEGRFE